MRVRIADEPAGIDDLLPENREDNSGVGINYADAYLKAFKTTLEDGRKVLCKRRGLKVTLTVGERKGEGLMRRLEHGPDVKVILRHALEEAAAGVGADLVVEHGIIYLDLEP
jgi:hypothetical protein